MRIFRQGTSPPPRRSRNKAKRRAAGAAVVGVALCDHRGDLPLCCQSPGLTGRSRNPRRGIPAVQGEPGKCSGADTDPIAAPSVTFPLVELAATCGPGGSAIGICFANPRLSVGRTVDRCFPFLLLTCAMVSAQASPMQLHCPGVQPGHGAALPLFQETGAQSCSGAECGLGRAARRAISIPAPTIPAIISSGGRADGYANYRGAETGAAARIRQQPSTSSPASTAPAGGSLMSAVPMVFFLQEAPVLLRRDRYRDRGRRRGLLPAARTARVKRASLTRAILRKLGMMDVICAPSTSSSICQLPARDARASAAAPSHARAASL